jgi:hypothetical protein
MMACPVQPSNEKLADSPLKIGINARRKVAIIASLVLFLSQSVPAQEQEERYGNPEHEREELGINRYTTPSIARIFDQLHKLRPLPFDKARRNLPAPAASSREQKGLIFGGLIADGFLIVAAERKNLVENYGRVLLREARGLGVGERVTRHSASLTQMGQRGNWVAVRKELVSTQADVEQAMVDLRDEKMAHLISLGGWLRGLEISAIAVAENFSTERTRILAEPELTKYFIEELKTLPPTLLHTPLFEEIRGVAAAIDSALSKTAASPLTLADVRSIEAQARSANDAIREAQSDR